MKHPGMESMMTMKILKACSPLMQAAPTVDRTVGTAAGTTADTALTAEN